MKKSSPPKGPALFLERMAVRRSLEARSQSNVHARACAAMNARALEANYLAIRDLAAGQAMLPMLKANAYGHGAPWAAGVLKGLPDLYGLGVATLEEGAQLRAALGAAPRVVVFSDTAPWSDEKGRFCEAHGLSPVVATDADWNLFCREGWISRLKYELMFNTGMNRLGLSMGSAKAVLTALKNRPPEARPQGIFSHLASAETPDSKLTRLQLSHFLELRRELSDPLSGTLFHLANSAGIWNQRSLGLKDVTDLVRPGLSLYGIPPWQGAPARGIFPVMTLSAQVVAVHRLKPGDSIGYGGTFVVGRADEPVYAAILGAGYADGIPRSLSSTGHAWLDGRPTRFLGVVSMDLCAIQGSAKTRVGDWAKLLGPNVDPWGQAKEAKTIPYELLTSVSYRVQRDYESDTGRHSHP